MDENKIVCVDVKDPVGSGLQAVLAILASIRCSTKQLTAAAELATNVIPSKAINKTEYETDLGKAITIPIKAQNTIKRFTLGLVRAKYCAKFEDWLTAVVILLTNPGYF